MNGTAQPLSSSEKSKNLATGVAAGLVIGLIYGFAYKSYWIGIPLGILVGVIFGFRLARAPIKMRFPMYMLRRMLLTGVFCLSLTFGFAVLVDRGIGRTQILLAAILPVLAWLLFVVSVVTAIASLDELQRRIQTEAIALGFAGTVFVCGAYGMLGVAHVVPALNWGLVVFVMVFMWFLGKLWTMWRYR
jgi:hypothetical protein